MVVGLLKARLSIPEARSLKDKRSVIRSLKDRARNRFNVSVAEVGDQDLWQVAEMAFITVAAEQDVVQKRLSEISSFLESNPRHILPDLHTELS